MVPGCACCLRKARDLENKTRRLRFAIVSTAKEHATGTVSGGDATCPFDDCGRLISGDHIKAEAHAGRMGEQLYTVVFKKMVITGYTKAGKPKEKWVRGGYRAPRPEDDVSQAVAEALAEKLPDWEAMDMLPTERVPADINDDRPIQYGMPLWRDLFSPRQLLGHGTAVEVFRELIDEEKASGRWNECTAAAFCYLSCSLDKLRDYNSRMSRWHVNREVMVNTFDRHDFAFKCYVPPYSRLFVPTYSRRDKWRKAHLLVKPNAAILPHSACRRSVRSTGAASRVRFGGLCPPLTPPQCFLNTPRRNTPCFPSNSDGHYTMQGLAGVAGCLRQPIDNGLAGRPELPRPLVRASASLRQFDDLLAKLRRVRWSAFRHLGLLVA